MKEWLEITGDALAPEEIDAEYERMVREACTQAWCEIEIDMS